MNGEKDVQNCGCANLEFIRLYLMKQANRIVLSLNTFELYIFFLYISWRGAVDAEKLALNLDKTTSSFPKGIINELKQPHKEKLEDILSNMKI
jgi:hypothetical protein